MNEIGVYFLDDSELAEYEAISKGYRIDVYVKTDTDFYNVRVYTLIRLQQDFDSEIENYGFYAIEPNLILVKEATKEEIVFTLKKLKEQKYFEEIRPMGEIDITQLKKVN